MCLCVQAAHLRLTQLSDKLDILTDFVSCWLQNEFGVFRIIAFWRSLSFRASHGASTRPSSGIYAHALPQAIRACGYTTTRAHNYYGDHVSSTSQSSRDLGAHHVVDFFKHTVARTGWLDLIRYHYVYAPQEGMSSV